MVEGGRPSPPREEGVERKTGWMARKEMSIRERKAQLRTVMRMLGVVSRVRKGYGLEVSGGVRWSSEDVVGSCISVPGLLL